MTDQLPRQTLPVPDRAFEGTLPYEATDPKANFPPIEPLRPPAGAPNVLVILLDDAGFGASSAFGGPCRTPTAERLAAGGLKYNRFHTTALCAPTRAALLSGRNHHTVGMGVITELATSAPGYSSVRPNTCAPLAQTLRQNGYSTAQFGKCHEVPVWQTSPMGPFDAWPTGGGGFEYFYGFVGGETNQYYPGIYEGTTAVEPETTPEDGYHFTQDMTDKAIGWIRQQKSLMPDKPFFVYYAPGATHAPHHVPVEWSDKYQGRFDQGWDALREEILARQKELGVVPPQTVLTGRHEEIPAWDDMPEELKPVLARQMEVYAGFMEHTDHHIGRLVDAIEDLGALDDTLVYYIIGDNGASAEGTINGSFNETFIFNGADRARDARVRGVADRRVRHPDRLQPLCGRLGTRDGHAVPVDQAGRLALGRHPQRHHRALAQRLHREGRGAGTVPPRDRRRPHRPRSRRSSRADSGQRCPATAHRGRRHGLLVRRRGRGRSTPDAVLRDVLQPRHLPRGLDGGDSAQHAVGDGAATRARGGCLGAVRHDHRLEPVPRPGRREPEKLAELQELWMTEARKYNVLPLDDRRIERFNSDLAGRPVLVTGNTQMLYGGMGRLTEASILNIKNKSHAVTAEVEVPESGAEGVIIAQGGAFAGWSLYAKDGKPRYCYNLLGLQRFTIEGETAIPAGTHQVRMEFGYDGGGLAKGRQRGALSRRRPRSARVASTPPSQWSSPPTRPPTSAATQPPRSAPTTTAKPASSPDESTGCRSISARTPTTPTT